MINMKDQEIQNHFEHLIFYIPSMIISNQDSLGIVVRFISFKISCCLFCGLKRHTPASIVANNQNSSFNRRGTTATRIYSKNKC